jgi:hypothetical protein
MLSVEAQIGMRMKNLGFGEPLSRKSVHERPRHPAPLTATSNHPQPAFANLEPKIPETGEIAGYGVIVEVALNHTPFSVIECTAEWRGSPTGGDRITAQLHFSRLESIAF